MPEPVVPRPEPPEAAVPVPAVVVSVIGATAAESIFVVTVMGPAADGVISTAESPEAVSLPVPLLQPPVAAARNIKTNTRVITNMAADSTKISDLLNP